jgi:hypothetical protein
MQFLLTTLRHLIIALWVYVRLSAGTPSFFDGWSGPWWELSRCELKLVEGILSTYNRCTLWALTHKLNVSRDVFIWKFVMFWYVELMPKFCLYLSDALCIYNIYTWSALQIFYNLLIFLWCWLVQDFFMAHVRVVAERAVSPADYRQPFATFLYLPLRRPTWIWSRVCRSTAPSWYSRLSIS